MANMISRSTERVKTAMPLNQNCRLLLFTFAAFRPMTAVRPSERMKTTDVRETVNAKLMRKLIVTRSYR